MRTTLTNENIDRACEAAEAYGIQQKVSSKDNLRVRLNVEEVLLAYQNALGPDAEFILDTGTGFGGRKIRLTIPGASVDPFVSDSSTDEDRFMRDAMIRMGQLPRWRYKRNRNEVLFTLEKKKQPEWVHLILAILAAVACAFLIRLFPESIQTLLLEGIVAPLLNTFLGFLNAVAGPMIFLSVVWGIYSIGDTATFSVMGKRVGGKYMLYLCLMAVAATLVSLPAFSLNYGEAQGGGDFSALYQMVLDIIPSNLFTPFSRGNTLQILFVAIIAGIAMLLIGKDTQSVADLSEQLGFIVNGIMNVVSKLIPAFVFGSLFSILATSDLEILATGSKFFFVVVLECLLLILIHIAITCVRAKLTPLDLWKRTFSTFLIAVTTASSSAAFSDNLKTCIEKLDISKRLARFGVPFGQTLYKPGVAVLYIVAVVSVAEKQQVQTSLTWLVTAVVMCIILSTAAPPVPGGMAASITILFTQLGLPLEDIAIILSLTSILDFIVTATNLFTGQCVLKVASLDYGETEDT